MFAFLSIRVFDCVFLSDGARARDVVRWRRNHPAKRHLATTTRSLGYFRDFTFVVVPFPLILAFFSLQAHFVSLPLSLPKNIQRDIIQSGGLLYTCGCVAFVPETMEIVEGGIEAETRQALTNMGEILKAGGSDFSKVVKTTIFITNMADFPKVNAIYSEFFDTPGPARSTVGVASLPKGGLIEIDAIAEC